MEKYLASQKKRLSTKKGIWLGYNMMGAHSLSGHLSSNYLIPGNKPLRDFAGLFRDEAEVLAGGKCEYQSGRLLSSKVVVAE